MFEIRDISSFVGALNFISFFYLIGLQNFLNFLIHHMLRNYFGEKLI